MNKEYRDIAYLRRYVDGELSHREMYDLERAAHQDEMLMDMLLGLEYEKSRNRPNDLTELRQRIKERVQPTPAKRLFSWAKWAVAASLFVAVIGVALYFSRDNGEFPEELVYQPISSGDGVDDIVVPDSIEEAKDVNNKIALAEEPSIAVEEQVTERKGSFDEASVQADKRGPIRENQTALALPKEGALATQRIAGKSLSDSQSWSNEVEEVTVVGQGLHQDSSALILNPSSQQLAYQGRDVKARDAGEYGSNSPAQVRAKFNSMDVDPQTSMILNQASVHQKVGQEQLDLGVQEDRRIEIKVGEGEYTYLANIKSHDKKSAQKNYNPQQQDVQSLLLSESSPQKVAIPQNSFPKGGWKMFDNYIGNGLKAKNIQGGYISYLFRLDETGIPQDIQIVRSSNADLNTVFRELLEKGPSWKVGNDSAQVKLDLKF